MVELIFGSIFMMLHSYLSSVADHRRAQGRRYELDYVLLFSVLAIVCGATSYRKIRSFIKVHLALFRDLYGVKWKRAPAHTSIRSILLGVNAEELESAFRAHSGALLEELEPAQNKWISLDGKTLRGSFDHFLDQKAVHMLSAFLQEHQLILGHLEIAEKSNEIPAVQRLIEELGLEGYTYTVDAMHCQKKTFEISIDSKSELIAQVKENQPNLLDHCQAIAEQNGPSSWFEEPFSRGRNRIENRSVAIFPAQLPEDNEWQPWVQAIAQVDRYTLRFDTKEKTWHDSEETAYYVLSESAQAPSVAQAIRGHWGIENRDHYVRDVTLKEDASRIRRNPTIFARLRSFALNILRANGIQNISETLYENALNIHQVLEYKGV